MLDVHVLSYNANPEFERQCVASIFEAVRNARYPINVHFLKGERLHIGKGRARGYARGRMPYVTYVDNDDYVLPQAFEALHDALDQEPPAVFPLEYVLQNNHVETGWQRHHLACYRRDLIIDHTKWQVCGDLAQVKSITDPAAIEVKEPVYVHRVYQSAGRILRRSNWPEWRRASGQPVR